MQNYGAVGAVSRFFTNFVADYITMIAMNKKIFLTSALLAASALAQGNAPKVYVDTYGVMRRSSDNTEVSYYGTNYTAPFAHAYRALGELGVDRKQAIDRDVYHLKRLGLNGFRLHLWDVELTDAQGNLQQNDHLDLLDYMIARLEERGIDIVLTAQTNFGNGYPEKNTDTGAYTYDYPKCGIHEDRQAQKAQARYLEQLARHVNPYTGKSYGSDPDIIAMEINNEPCHSGTARQITDYINRMVKALRKGGFDKPILYNVSHNTDLTRGYYDADIRGTTYQWYPIGLVAGHERKGNFLPFVDEYTIPWKETMKNYGKLARVVYEFDPGDILYSYMYPAIARTFRKEGFQWITQFAYDPTDMAAYNTEYQTHFLNLAYTPAKAISMLIAGEVARGVKRGEDFGSYPANTRFAGFSVDGEKDLSMMNSGDKYYYTRSTQEQPADAAAVAHIAGIGASPMVSYGGTGAYFLDRLDSRNWRLEVMPDVVLTEDPFAKPSLKRRVGEIIYADHPMKLSIPSLGQEYSYIRVGGAGEAAGRASEGTLTVSPGVYVLSADAAPDGKWTAETPYGDGRMKVGEFVAPAASAPALPKVAHTPAASGLPGGKVRVVARVVAAEPVDSVVIYPSDVSFWREDNKLYAMTRTEDDPYGWTAEVPVWPGAKELSYNIVAYSQGKPATYPAGMSGTPLDWDYPENAPMYRVKIQPADAPAVLISAERGSNLVESGSIPDGQGVWLEYVDGSPLAADALRLNFTPQTDSVTAVVKGYVAPVMSSASGLDGKKRLVLTLDNCEGIEDVEIGLVDSKGLTRSARVSLKAAEKTPWGLRLAVPLEALHLSETLLVPAAYPSFMARTFTPTGVADTPADLRHTDFVTVSFPGLPAGRPVKADLRSLLLE